MGTSKKAWQKELFCNKKCKVIRQIRNSRHFARCSNTKQKTTTKVANTTFWEPALTTGAVGVVEWTLITVAVVLVALPMVTVTLKSGVTDVALVTVDSVVRLSGGKTLFS